MQLGDKIAALQQRVEQGEADQPASESKPAAAKENADPAETPEVAPRDSDDDTTAVPAPVSYAAAAKPVRGEEEEDEPQITVQQALDDLEAQLAKLTAELDDKVRFSKGTGERESRWK
jgi:molybdopterin converting factor small subunit